MQRAIFGVLLTCFLSLFAAEARGRNVLLVIGGGPDPGSNQWSLQRNVEFACKTLTAAKADEAWDVQIYFADGPAAACDVQRKVADRPESRAVWWLSLLANRREMPVMEYVDHAFPQGSQAATKDNLARGVQQLSDSLAGGDRLLVYVTAHGGPAETGEYYGESYGEGPSEDENPFNTTLALWGGETVDAAEFSQWLDRFQADVEVTLVMTQCYSGGFANVLFHNADRRQGLNDRPRCGFFSQRHDRVAAGCTPEIDEGAYEEYSSSFWAALGSVDRLGHPMPSADYDHDGRVTFDEAHAYTVLHSETLDIPLRSSDVVLRKFSKIEAGDGGEAQADQSGGGFFGRIFGGGSADADEPRDLPSVNFTAQSTLAELSAAARPEQRAVLDGLAEKLGVASATTLTELREKRAGEKKAVDRVGERQRRIYGRLMDSLSQLEERVEQRWPQLGEADVTYMMFQLASSGADDFVAFVESQPAADAVEVRITEIESLGDKVAAAEVKEARWQRIVQAAEIVALQNNLATHAPAEIVTQYRRLLELEARGL